MRVLRQGDRSSLDLRSRTRRGAQRAAVTRWLRADVRLATLSGLSWRWCRLALCRCGAVKPAAPATARRTRVTSCCILHAGDIFRSLGTSCPCLSSKVCWHPSQARGACPSALSMSGADLVHTPHRGVSRTCGASSGTSRAAADWTLPCDAVAVAVLAFSTCSSCSWTAAERCRMLNAGRQATPLHLGLARSALRAGSA